MTVLKKASHEAISRVGWRYIQPYWSCYIHWDESRVDHALTVSPVVIFIAPRLNEK